MMVIPNQPPIVEGLNSYYLNVRKFFEHQQSELGCCGIHLKSPHMETMVYFDSGQLLSATCRTNAGSVTGEEAMQQLMSAVEKHNFTVSVYQIDPDMIYFWANALHATPLHRDLSTDITDLDRLIAKMINQQLNGFIEVLIGNGTESGILFFNNGKIIGANTSAGEAGQTVEYVHHLVAETTAKGGTFNVSTICHHQKSEVSAPKRVQSKDESVDAGTAPPAPPSLDPIPMIEEVLSLAASVCTESKRARDFATHFRKAAVELADKYSFLDPFLNEFEFSGGKLRLERNVQPQALAAGVLECIQRMMTSLGLASRFRERADGWFRVNAKHLKGLGVKLSSR
jgi:hypothetical protein